MIQRRQQLGIGGGHLVAGETADDLARVMRGVQAGGIRIGKEKTSNDSEKLR